MPARGLYSAARRAHVAEAGRVIVSRVNETGARGDGRADDRPSLQTAVDRVAAAGGGAVVVPAGLCCRTGTLHLERGGSLVASDRPGDYPSTDRPVVRAGTSTSAR